MTVINVDLRKPSADGVDKATGDGAALECVPTARRNVGDHVTLPAAFTEPLVNGQAQLDLAPTVDGTWAWKITERGVDGGIKRLVAVPASGPVNYGELDEVDPATLDPTTPPVPVYKALIDAAQSTADEAVEGVAAVAGAVVELGQVVDTKLDEAEVTAKIEEGVAETPGRVLTGLDGIRAKHVAGRDVIIGIAGDSTGNELGEWAGVMLGLLAPEFPERTFQMRYWDDATQAYVGTNTIQTGSAPAGGTVNDPGLAALDTFARTAADLYGSPPEAGGAWTTDYGTGAPGEWSLSGAGTARTATAASGKFHTLDTQRTGRKRLKLTLSLDTTPLTSGTKDFRFGVWLNSTNYVFGQFTQSNSPTALPWSIVTNIGGALTAIATGGVLPFPIDSTTRTIDILLDVNTASASLTINGNTISGTFASGTYTNATRVFLGSGLRTGGVVTRMSVDTVAGSVAPVTRVWNASMPGSVIDYHTSRVAAMFPASVVHDLVFINTGHNHSSQTPAAFLTKLTAFIAALRAVQPTAGIVLMSQNPRKPPAYNVTDHAARFAALAPFAKARGYGYLPIFESWSQLPNRGFNKVLTDGIHPTIGANSGSAFWGQEVYDAITV